VSAEQPAPARAYDDAPLSADTIRPIAASLTRLTPAQLAVMRGRLNFQRHDEFYWGMLAGMLMAVAYCREEQSLLAARTGIGIYAAVLADEVLRRGAG
jgi:protein-L-isoaspartate O-methyltransferase